MLNYIRETKAFMEAGFARPLSPKAQLLWHHLLYFNNQAALKDEHDEWHWPVWFEVDNSLLVKSLGLKHSRQLYDYRKSLVENGFIRHRFGHRQTGRSSAGEYALCPMTAGFQEIRLVLPGHLNGVLVWTQDPTQFERVDPTSQLTGYPTGDQPSSYFNKCVNVINDIARQRGEAPPDIACLYECYENGRRAARGEGLP